MKVADEALWQKQCAAFASAVADGDQFTGPFSSFLVEWAELAEQLLDETGEDRHWSPAAALRATLDEAEEAHGRLPISALAMVIVLLIVHWHHGDDELADSLTPVELRLIQEAAELKLNDLRAAAHKLGDEIQRTSGGPDGGVRNADL